jgi:hypothetical protein
MMRLSPPGRCFGPARFLTFAPLENRRMKPRLLSVEALVGLAAHIRINDRIVLCFHRLA